MPGKTPVSNARTGTDLAALDDFLTDAERKMRDGSVRDLQAVHDIAMSAIARFGSWHGRSPVRLRAVQSPMPASSSSRASSPTC